MKDSTERLSNLSPLKITLIYLFAAVSWIVLTDFVLENRTAEFEVLSQIQTYKGLLYVILTSAGLYLLIKMFANQIESKDEELKGLHSDRRSDRELMDILFERIPVMITIYDPDLEEFEVNREFEKVTGWTNEDAKEHDLFKACYPDIEQREEVVEFMNNPGIGWKELTIATKSGDTVETSWTNVRLTDDTSVGIGIDMTETKASQAELRESRELLRNTFESLEESVMLIEPKTRVIKDCNKATEKIFGYSKEELIGQSTRMLHLDKEHYEKFDEIGENALEQKGSFHTEFQMKKKSGDPFFSDHTVTLVYDEQGEVDRIVSVVRDITAKKKNEKELIRRQERLLRSQKIGKIGDWEFEPITEKINWSPMMYEIYDRDPEQGPPSFDMIKSLYYGEDSQKHNKRVIRAVQKGEAYDIDLQLQTEKGNRKYIRAIGIPEQDETGEVQKLHGTVQDITERKEAEIERKKLADIVQKSQNEIYVLDAETLQFEFVNKGAINNIGYSLEEMLQMTPMDIKPEFDRETIRQKLDPIISGEEEKIKFETYQERANGSTYEVEVHAQIIETAGKPLIVAILLDITERKKAERALRKNELRLKNITNNIPGVVFQYKLNPDGTDELQYVSEGAKRIWGMSPEEAINNNEIIWSRIHNSDIENVKNSIQKSAENLSKWDEEWQYIKPDGSQHWQHGIGIPRKDNDGSIIWDSVIFDITERKRLREQVVQSIIEGEDRERKRIARELHDGIGQYLSAANMNLEAMKKDVAQLSEKRKAQFSKGLGLLKQSISEIRNISHNLMPKAIEDYGLITAVEAMVDNYENSTDIAIRFDNNIQEELLTEQKQLNIYRIIQESLHNATKYAGCEKISIQLYQEKNILYLTIEDDGKGSSFYDMESEEGLGLKSIRSRTKALSGSIQFDSVPEKGTVMSLQVPIELNTTIT